MQTYPLAWLSMTCGIPRILTPCRRRRYGLAALTASVLIGIACAGSPDPTDTRLAQAAAPSLTPAGQQPSLSTGFDHAHKGLAQVLTRYAAPSGVDYAALKANPDTLNAYLNELDQVSEAQFRAWPRPEQLAFLINLYNATTIKLVVDHYPVSSIRKIGGLFRSPWKLEVVRIWGQDATLDWLEHGFIRPQFKDPRIHFALVCAARGCPPLRLEPFVASKLDNQLDDQGRRFIAQSEKNRFDSATRTLHVSPIFKWYREDFIARDRTLAQFLKPFFPPAQATLLDQPGLRVDHTAYDWSLNDVVKETR